MSRRYSAARSDVEISKELVRVLRHGKYGLKMDSHGYVCIDDILQVFETSFAKVSLRDVQQIVNGNSKKRFEMQQQGGRWMIKATQGHSIAVERLDLLPITDPFKYQMIVHGTKRIHWKSIQQTGLRRLRRTHIHFAIGMPGDPRVTSGMPPHCNMAIFLDFEKAVRGGLKFYESSNQVVLTEGDHRGRIHPKYFKKAVTLPAQSELHFDIPPDFTD